MSPFQIYANMTSSNPYLPVSRRNQGQYSEDAYRPNRTPGFVTSVGFEQVYVTYREMAYQYTLEMQSYYRDMRDPWYSKKAKKPRNPKYLWRLEAENE